MTNTRSAIAANAVVVTSDGAELGRVDATTEHAFKVNAPLQPDYWLSRATVMALRNGEVVVGFEEAHLDEFKEGSAEEAARVKATQVLVQMHGEAKAKFRAILAAASPASATRLWNELQPALEVHEQMEEMHLYQPLAEAMGNKDLGAYQSEHQAEVREVEEIIHRAGMLETGSREWADEIAQVRDMLEEHMAEEEVEIFPRIRQHWNDERLAQVGAAMLAMKTARLGEPYSTAA